MRRGVGVRSGKRVFVAHRTETTDFPAWCAKRARRQSRSRVRGDEVTLRVPCKSSTLPPPAFCAMQVTILRDMPSPIHCMRYALTRARARLPTSDTPRISFRSGEPRLGRRGRSESPSGWEDVISRAALDRKDAYVERLQKATRDFARQRIWAYATLFK